jgi:hypothetical protein
MARSARSARLKPRSDLRPATSHQPLATGHQKGRNPELGAGNQGAATSHWRPATRETPERGAGRRGRGTSGCHGCAVCSRAGGGTGTAAKGAGVAPRDRRGRWRAQTIGRGGGGGWSGVAVVSVEKEKTFVPLVSFVVQRCWVSGRVGRRLRGATFGGSGRLL